MTSPPLPPVILLGIDSPIGLAVLRELGGHGIEVHGVARNSRALGLYSRYLRRGYVRPPAAAELPSFLRDIGSGAGAPFLLTVSMGDSLAMRAAADAGQLDGLQVLLPPLKVLQLVNDKAAICEIADRLGIATPVTWQPDMEDWDGDKPLGLRYPCVLKWRDPEIAAGPLGRLGLPLLKSEYVYDEAGLRAALLRYRPLGMFPMVQSYAPGTGLGQMFVMNDGVATLRFQHRRIHEWPPEGGTSTLCESVGLSEHADPLERSEALLREIGWEGPAMVEYRYDAARDEAVLMEINGRFWGSLPLAYHAGAPFALATYYALGLRQHLPRSEVYRAGLRCRYMIPETRRLIKVTVGRGSIADRSLSFSPLRELLAYAKGFVDGSRYFVFTLRDPLPFLADMGFVLKEAVLGIIGKVAARKGARADGKAAV